MRILRRPGQTEEKQSESNTLRLEAFSDGVFAIAITLLILEIKIPQLRTLTQTGQSLRAALLGLWPSYLAYVFSFVIVGIYWANHHFIFKLYKQTDHFFNLLNLLFLMCISFLPLPTEILGEYVSIGEAQRTAVFFYNVGLALPAYSWLLTWLYGSYKYRLIDPHLDPRFVRHLTRQYLFSTACFSTSCVVSLWNAPLSLVISVGMTLLYLLPPKKPVYRKATAGSAAVERTST